MRREATPEAILDRREFVVGSLLAMLGGVTVTISGCVSSPTAPTAATPDFSSDKAGAVSGNHGHVAVITSAQLRAGGAVALNIQGSASHTHTVELSAAEVMQIRDGQRVSKESSLFRHAHMITFNDDGPRGADTLL
jgi:hypothetical protein